ncbi:MAG: CPBP family glutamic-type intramembrane protease [Acidimicrobiales bacterium]
MTDASHGSNESRSSEFYAPGWYPDPWRVAPWRWWDGVRWTPGLYGPYGEAWPVGYRQIGPAEPKGPGIQGGGVAAVGALVGALASVVVSVVYLVIYGLTFVAGEHPWYLLMSELPLWAGFVGATIYASRVNGTKSFARDYGLSWPTAKDFGSGVVTGVIGRVWPLLLVFLAVWATHQELSKSSPQILGETPRGITGWFVVILVTVICAPVVEELFFRGLVQGAFTRRVGAVPAIFITALVFSLSHVTGEGVFAPIVLFPIALLLGYLRHKTGRLAAGMVAHATFNATVLLLFLVPALR